MALVNCKECKKEISSKVKQCPHCGSSKHRGFIRKHPVLTVIIALFAIGYIPKLFLDNKIEQTKQQESKAKEYSNKESVSGDISKGSTSKEEQLIENNWSYEVEEDKMRGIKNSYATSISKNTANLEFPYNNSKMKMTVRNMNNETNVLITVKGQIVCNEYSERCYLNVKSDNNPIVKYDFNKAAHGHSDTVFIKKHGDFINMLKKSNHVIIEAPLYNNGMVQYEFDVIGLNWK